MIKTAHRMDQFASQFFAAISSKIAALQAAGKDIIRLDIGSPDLPPPQPVIQALARSAGEAANHGYQTHSATPAYRSAWAEMYRRLYQVDLDADREIVPLMGSKEGIFNMITAHIDPGDAVLIPDPGYMTYTRGTLFAGGEPVFLPLLPERDFLPDLGAVPVEAARRAKLLWLNYPNNPTAATATPEFFAEAVDFAREHGLLICHDAAYTQVTFDGYRAPSILEAPGAKEVAVEFNTLSKSHNMAGWRVGAAVGNAQALRGLYALKTNLDSGHFLPILEAAVAAMTGDQSWIPGRNEVYRQRRDCILPALRAIGLQAAAPLGSLYVWCRIPVGKSSVEFAAEVLEKCCVSLTPGAVFGAGGEGYVRISLTAPIERVEEAVHRLGGILENGD
jgi:LL-diaminopimelate aminotransferase